MSLQSTDNTAAPDSACKILIAEDSSGDVFLVREALLEYGITCALHVVRDGAQAIAFIENLDRNPHEPCPDVVLLDMHLPLHDGEEILEKLRSAESCAQTPVVIMTASDSPRDKQAAQKHAALHFFRKPSSLAEYMQLGGIIKNILDTRPCPSPDSHNRTSQA